MAEYWKSKPSCWFPPPGGKLSTYKQGRIVRADKNLTPTELKIVEEFITATAADGFCNHKISKLAMMLNKTERTIKRALKGLWEKDYIRFEKRHNKSSLYMLGCKLVPEAPSNKQSLEKTEEQLFMEWEALYEFMCIMVPDRSREWRTLTTDDLYDYRDEVLKEWREGKRGKGKGEK